jgi:hypothetical protein
MPHPAIFVPARSPTVSADVGEKPAFCCAECRISEVFRYFRLISEVHGNLRT